MGIARARAGAQVHLIGAQRGEAGQRQAGVLSLWRVSVWASFGGSGGAAGGWGLGGHGRRRPEASAAASFVRARGRRPAGRTTGRRLTARGRRPGGFGVGGLPQCARRRAACRTTATQAAAMLLEWSYAIRAKPMRAGSSVMHGIGPAIACFPDIAGSTNASPLHDPGPTTSSKQLTAAPNYCGRSSKQGNQPRMHTEHR